MRRFIISAFADEADKMLDGQIAALKENQIDMIELRNVDGTPVAKMTCEQAADARKRLQDQGVTLSALGSPYGKYPIDQAFAPHLDAFRHGLELCRILHTDQMRMFSFFIPTESGADEWANAVEDRLEIMLSYATDAGVTLCHENEKGIYGDNETRCLKLMDRFEGRMGFIFDPANFIQCNTDPLQAMTVMKNRIRYMHIKDAMKADGTVVPAGKGDGSLSKLLQMLPEGEKPMILTLEPHLHVFDALKSLQGEALKFQYVFKSPRAAFDAACAALRDLLEGIA